ncbi:MAG: sigma-70 family RNA polymerase sigma factor [Chlorobi bacterium]|nr:sigma-70 family RNA polymerase sigma factor [Chlorobiota bacterium]
MAETDEDIITRVMGGEQEAFALLVDRYKDKVFALVMGVLKNRELAEEVAQDVFVKVYLSLRKFRNDAKFSTWIYRISYNSAISETRKSSYKNTVLDGQYLDNVAETKENNDENMIKEEEQQKLSRAISALKPDERCILRLYYFEEKAINDISRITGLGQSNVKIKLHRMRKKLKSLIEEDEYKTLVVN